MKTFLIILAIVVAVLVLALIAVVFTVALTAFISIDPDSLPDDADPTA